MNNKYKLNIDISKLHFIGYSVGVFSTTVIVRVPHYANLNKFMHNNISYNHTSINTFVLIESNSHFFIGIINKESMSEKDKRNLIDDDNTELTETPELYVNILSEINPVNFHLIGRNQYFPVIHSKVYVANELLIKRFIREVSKDVNVVKKIKKNKKYTDNLQTINKSENFATLVQDSRIKVDLSFNTLFGRHLGIIGSTGSGKSYTAAKLIYNLSENFSKNKYPIILLDPTGEYNTLVNSIKNDGKSVTKFDIGIDTRIPYYDLNDNELYKLIKPSQGIQMPKLKAAIDDLKYISLTSNSNNNIMHWQDRKYSKVYKLKKYIEFKIHSGNPNNKIGYNFSGLPHQIHQECYRFYKNNSVARINEGDWSYCAPLADRINMIISNPFFSKYFCNSPYDKIKVNDKSSGNVKLSNKKNQEFQDVFCYRGIDEYNIIYINLSNVTLANSIAEIIGDYIARKLLESFIRNTNEHGAPKHPAVLFLDEAHNFIKKDNVNDDYHLHYFDLIAKEGRKYGLLMTLITQSPNDLSRDVLTQFGTFIIHHLGNDIERQKVASALPYNSNLDQYMSSLNTGEAIISSNNMYNPLLVNINKIKDPKYRPKSNTPKF